MWFPSFNIFQCTCIYVQISKQRIASYASCTGSAENCACWYTLRYWSCNTSFKLLEPGSHFVHRQFNCFETLHSVHSDVIKHLSNCTNQTHKMYFFHYVYIYNVSAKCFGVPHIIISKGHVSSS